MYTADPSRSRLRSSSYLYYYSYFPLINSISRFPPWSTPSSYCISHQLSFPCSRNNPLSLHNAAATSHLSSLPHSNITALTDGSVSVGMGQGGAGIHSKCTKCLTATYLSFLTGLCASSFSAETYAILHALEWCISHYKSCGFESINLCPSPGISRVNPPPSPPDVASD